MNTIQNPITKRQIKIGGDVYLKLVKQGIIVDDHVNNKKVEDKPINVIEPNIVFEDFEYDVPFVPLPSNEPIFPLLFKSI